MSVEEVRRQSITNFMTQIAFTFLGFFSTIYFARTVGPSILGAYFLFISYLGIVQIVTNGGLGGAAIKRISEGEKPDEYFTAFFFMRVALTLLIIICIIFLRPYFVDLDNAGVFGWLLLALVISMLNGLITSGIAGRGKMGINATGDFVRNVSRIIIQVFAIYLGFGLAGLIGGFIAGLLVGALAKFRFFDLKLVLFKSRHIKDLLSFSFWLFLSSAGVVIYSHADTIMIGYFFSNTEVGIYQVVFQFATLTSIVTEALQATLWPKVSKWGKSGERVLIETALSKALNFSLVIGVPVFAGGVLLGDRILYFFYGAEFSIGYYTLGILLLTQLVNVFQHFFTMYLNALNRQKASFMSTATGTLANIVLNIILIPLIGIEGAAIATLTTMGINALLAGRFLSHNIQIRFDTDTLVNIARASIVMIIFVCLYRLLIPLSSLVLTLIPILIGAIIYVVLILKFDRGMYNEIRDIASKMGIPWPPLL